MVAVEKGLVEQLQAIVGPDNATSPADSPQFVIDGLPPKAIVMPSTYEEVAAVMRFANDRGLAVVPQSHGAITWIGNTPRAYDIALSVARLNAIVEYEPADLTITCQAGATLKELHSPLSENGQMIPFAGGASSSCIGRLLGLPMRESNLAWGSARDSTIGMRVVTADGRIVRTGGNVVKNVAGYDLTKLFIGSMGSLGVIIEATFKLAPAPQAKETLRFEFANIADGCRFASSLIKGGFSVSHAMMIRSMSLTDEGATPRGFSSFGFQLAGSTAAVARSRTEIEKLAPRAGGSADIIERPKREGPLPAWTRVANPLTCEALVLPSLVPDLIDGVDEEAPGAFVEGSPATGFIALTWLGAGADEDLVRRVRAITSRLGGTLVVTGCDPELKRQIDVFGDPPPSFELMRRVKQQFDPNAILSPGRFVGRL